MSQSLPLCPRRPVARCGTLLLLLASMAWALSGCSLLRPPSSVPKPPLLVDPSEPMPRAQGQTAGAAPAEAAQAGTLQALLARSDISLRLIDAGRMGDLWAWAAPFVQATGQGERILSDIGRARAALGPVQGRGRAGAQGVQSVRVGPESRMPPPGQYANVEYTAQLGQGASAIERLSFRLESDGWRFVGYTAQRVPAAPPPVGEPAAAAPAR